MDSNWDANWLVVRGEIGTADGRGWTFLDPCLSTWEALSVGEWLRAVAAGGPAPDDPRFTEPNLAFELDGRHGERHRRRPSTESP